MHELSETADTIADRFTHWCEAVVGRLPFGLNRLVPATFLGFALINSGTFAVDLALLTVLHGLFDLPIWLAVTVAYVCAFGISFVLNRTFNFHSHAPVGRQAAIYVVVVVVNYFAFILGVGSGLTALGLQYHVSRLLAGACEAVYMYSAMRWVVFRRSVEPRPRPVRDANRVTGA
ncbi:GtrA family protein [Nocardia asiatica]|uniref:GtrA family protein n=1 Tax=Nocardia asiatica TaxID=209252 RepID=UPI0002EB9266|nr:GtrA family protein [Nocardia asiatica]